MRPSCRALNRLRSGRSECYATFALSEEAKQAIRLWRAMLFLVQDEFDASLFGARILLFKRSNDAEVCLGGSAIDLRFLRFQEELSSQNFSGFLGKILGIIAFGNGENGTDIRLILGRLVPFCTQHGGHPRPFFGGMDRLRQGNSGATPS